jgi:uncharacterized membrane protein YkoI
MEAIKLQKNKCSIFKNLKTMKKLLFAIAFMTAGSVAVLAQDTASVATPAPATPTETTTQDQDGQAIAASELPASIQSALQGQDYSGWTVGNAMKKEKDGKTFYSVELSNGSETKKVKFDADGNVVKEKD